MDRRTARPVGRAPRPARRVSRRNKGRMMLTLYAHPLSSFCWKALIALYENDTPFELHLLDQSTWGEFAKRWPVARMPALEDSDRKQFVPEATIIIEYLDEHYRGGTRFIPD